LKSNKTTYKTKPNTSLMQETRSVKIVSIEQNISC